MDTILLNAKNLGFAGQVRAVGASVYDFLKNPSTYCRDNADFSLITITPPYEEIVYKELLDAVCDSPALINDAIVVVEYPVEIGSLPFIINEKLYGLRNRKYGRTVIATYVYKPTRSYDMKEAEFLPAR